VAIFVTSAELVVGTEPCGEYRVQSFYYLALDPPQRPQEAAVAPAWSRGPDEWAYLVLGMFVFEDFATLLL
jgi:hypothetical protein